MVERYLVSDCRLARVRFRLNRVSFRQWEKVERRFRDVGGDSRSQQFQARIRSTQRVRHM